jgi:hypothetical protein
MIAWLTVVLKKRKERWMTTSEEMEEHSIHAKRPTE